MAGLLFTVDIVPGIADQRDLVKESAVDAQVASHVHILVTAVEHLALCFLIGVEPRLGFGRTAESRVGNVVQHRENGVPGSDQCLNFLRGQSRFQQIPDVFPLETVLLHLTGGDPKQAKKNQELHYDYILSKKNFRYAPVLYNKNDMVKTLWMAVVMELKD